MFHKYNFIITTTTKPEHLPVNLNLHCKLWLLSACTYKYSIGLLKLHYIPLPIGRGRDEEAVLSGCNITLNTVTIAHVTIPLILSPSSYDKPLTVTTTDLNPPLMRFADDTLHMYTVPFSAGITGPCWSEELLLTTELLPSVH